MLLATVNALTISDTFETPEQVVDAYQAHQSHTGRGNTAFTQAARVFMRSWPHPQDWADEDLDVQLSANSATRPFITFLLVTGRLNPGWDYMVNRKFSSLWRDVPGTDIGADLTQFIEAAKGCGYSERVASAMASQVMARVLFATGKPLARITHDDFDALFAAGIRRQQNTGRTWKHYRTAATGTKTVLFHMGFLPALPQPSQQPWPFTRRLEAVPEPMHSMLVRYLQCKSVTCKPKTVSGLATRLKYFALFVTAIDPELSPRELTRCDHIEPWLASLPHTLNTKTGALITVAEQSRRILAAGGFLSDITEWQWDQAPTRKLLYSCDNPRLPQPLPRFLPPDADRRLIQELNASTNRLPADALLLQRACGLRIGELLDLELNSVIDTPNTGSWLKVPLGKLDTERLVPIDEETLNLIDRITKSRSPGRAIPHPTTGKPAQFLFTSHGRRLTATALRGELRRAATAAGIGHVTPHQLRHTYATALVNAGVSLQALMSILGHVSAEMSLRYGHLFDATIRTEYERALDLARNRIGALPQTTNNPEPPTTWMTKPTIKTALAGGYCLRAPAQQACNYANICEHCPSFHTTIQDIPVLTRQRDIAATLANDAQHRGWDTETERHLKLITRLNNLIDNTTTRPNAE